MEAIICIYPLYIVKYMHEMTSLEYFKLQMLTILRGEINEGLGTLYNLTSMYTPERVVDMLEFPM
jgi:hypothetical protein